MKLKELAILLTLTMIRQKIKDLWWYLVLIDHVEMRFFYE